MIADAMKNLQTYIGSERVGKNKIRKFADEICRKRSNSQKIDLPRYVKNIWKSDRTEKERTRTFVQKSIKTLKITMYV